MGNDWRFDSPQALDIAVMDHHPAGDLPTESSMIPSNFRFEDVKTEGQDPTATSA